MELVGFGTLRVAETYNFWKVIQIRYFLATLVTSANIWLPAPRTIVASSGSSKIKNSDYIIGYYLTSCFLFLHMKSVWNVRIRPNFLQSSCCFSQQNHLSDVLFLLNMANRIQSDIAILEVLELLLSFVEKVDVLLRMQWIVTSFAGLFICADKCFFMICQFKIVWNVFFMLFYPDKIIISFFILNPSHMLIKIIVYVFGTITSTKGFHK